MKNHPLIKGTIMLTLTGMFSRFIGFFYRIYLSRTFGEEGMGLYQLLGPVLALSFSLCGAGIQTSISKFVAGKCDNLSHNPQGSQSITLPPVTLTVLAIVRQCLCPASSALPASDQFVEAGAELLPHCSQADPAQLKLPLPEPCPDLEAVAYCACLSLGEQSLKLTSCHLMDYSSTRKAEVGRVSKAGHSNYS